MINQALANYLSQLKEQGLHRNRIERNAQAINFCSNDYLSLTQEPQIRKAFQKGFASYPVGSGGSMLISGYYGSHRELEREFSRVLDVDASLLFGSGYAANLGIISLLAHLNAHILIDKAAHASFYDGLRLANAKYNRYLPMNFAALEKKLQKPLINPVVISESIFSMSGQGTLLDELANLCKLYSASCVIDEAHAFGVVGAEGLGAVRLYGLSQDEIPLRIIPLGKAMACQGAIVAGRGDWINALQQVARSYIYSTAISPALAYGLLETLLFIRKAADRRQKIAYLLSHFQQAIKNSPLRWRNSLTPIQQLELGCPHKARACANYLHQKGYFCQAIRQPTVSKKNTGLRVTINYCHETNQIDDLFFHLHQFERDH